MINVAAAFLLLSGTASLTYQVVWVRLLGLSMGSTSASISTVLAAFFLGLAIGSYLAERITRNRIHDLTVYIVLEAVIGCAGLLLLPVLLNLDYWVTSIPHLAGGIGFKFCLSILLLSIPTICMGATFPVMASILIRANHEVGLRMGQLYSLNTAGAVCGAALSGFYFIPNWGLDGAVYIAATINALIVIVGYRINKRLELPPLEHGDSLEDSVTEVGQSATPFRGRALLVLVATGMVSIAIEVGWTKYLSVFTGTTIYGFAAILTVFLIGIAGGSWWVKSHLQQLRQPQLWLAAGLLLLAVSLFFTRAALTSIPPIYQAINHFPVEPWLKHFVKYAYVFLLLIVPTLIFGALFPLNLRLYCGNLSGVRSGIGKAYAANTVAGIFGSVLAGFFIIPNLGTDWLLSASALLIALLALAFINTVGTGFARASLVAGIILTASSNWFFSHINFYDLISSVQYDDQAYEGKVPDYLFLKEGKAGVISLSSYDGRHIRLQNNGLNESFLDLEDQRNVLLAETLLGLMPYFLHKDAKNAFVVGYGGGVTTRALAATKLSMIKVVELEPAVIEAGKSINNGEIPLLQDPRVSLDINDARNTLLLDKSKYDIIVSQPSHPWLARASNVFTENFFRIVHSRLSAKGIYGQWVNLFNMDVTTLKSILKAFYNVFPEGMSFANLDTGDLLLFGSDAHYDFDNKQTNQRIKEDKVNNILDYFDIKNAKDLMWYFSLSRDQIIELTKDATPNSDTNILSEVRLSRLYGDAQGKENPYSFIRSQFRFDVLPYLSGNKTEKLKELADYFFYWNKPKVVQRIAEHLDKLDKMEARSVRLRADFTSYLFDKVVKDFRASKKWPPKSGYFYVESLLKLSKFKEARDFLTSMPASIWRDLGWAKYYFHNQDWQALRAVKSDVATVEMWRMIALARQNQLIRAGEGLLKIQANVEYELPQLEVLVVYYGLKNDQANLRLYNGKLQNMIADRRGRVIALLKDALKDKETRSAQRLLEELASLNPSDKEIQSYKKKVAQLAQAK